jgi:hypothetical protein
MTLEKKSPLIQAFEVIGITVAIMAIGYFVDVKDPLLIHYNFSFLILWLAVVTLFYGLTMGLVMWIVFAIVSSVLYIDDNIFIFTLLENLFFVFLFGLFFSNLHKEIDKYKIKTQYLQLRLKELTNAFFTLKISHDKLESIYIIQPASIRFVISEILESNKHSTPKESADNTLKILKKFFGVNSAMIYRVKRDSLRGQFASIGDIDRPSLNDKLIYESIIQKRAMYLDDLDDREQTEYIYAVPFLDKRDSVVAILIIKDIPFLFYNKDTILKISVSFNYIWTEYKKRASLKRIEQKRDIFYIEGEDKYKRQDIVDFKIEVERLTNVLDGYNIDSRIYSIYTKNKYLNKEITDFLYQNELFEILDQYISIKCGNRYIHFILFPFVSLPSLHAKAKSLDEELDEIEGRLRIEMLEDGLKYHLSSKNFEGLRKKHISVKIFNNLLQEYGCV